MTNETRVKLTLHPSGGDKEDVSAADFIKQVSALRDLVVLSAGPADDVEARIVGLSRSSPATIVLEAFWKTNNKPIPVEAFFESVAEVTRDGAAPRFFGRPVFDALKELASVVGKGVRLATLSVGKQVIEIEHQARQNIERVFEPDSVAAGTVDGMLEAVNIHGKRNVFNLYPVVGPRRVTCYFDEGMFKDIRSALGRYVIISGDLKYRWREKFPYEAMIQAFETVDEADQPNFADVIGMAPDATGGLLSEEFVRQLRGVWN